MFVALFMVASLTAQAPRFVPGQVLTKFVAGSEAATAVMRADLAGLVPIADRLGAGVGVPLWPASITSGHFCVLSVDADRLEHQLARQLSARQRVERVEVVEDTSTIAVSVAFAAGSEESRMRPARLVALLEKELGLPLKGEVLENRRLALQVNLETLTLSLVERLKTLPDVESAQPNFIVKAFMR